jgi:hypothetical protein
MGICVCMGAMLQCPFGVAPSTLIVNSQVTALASSKPIATIMDNKPMANIPPFGMCSCPANPATVKPPPVMFAPAPCVPVITAPMGPGFSHGAGGEVSGAEQQLQTHLPVGRRDLHRQSRADADQRSLTGVRFGERPSCAVGGPRL